MKKLRNPIENTSRREPLDHIIGAMGLGTSGYVEGMEAAGQQQVVNSDKIPTSGYKDEDLEALGFKLGPVVEGDDLFRTCELPEGWYREGTGHSMHSVIRDERGYGRISIFYKAAFYDRSAQLTIVRLPRTKAQEDVWEAIDPGHEDWRNGRDRRKGDNYVYCYRGRYGKSDPPEGKHAYSDDGHRLEVEGCARWLDHRSARVHRRTGGQRLVSERTATIWRNP